MFTTAIYSGGSIPPNSDIEYLNNFEGVDGAAPALIDDLGTNVLTATFGAELSSSQAIFGSTALYASSPNSGQVITGNDSRFSLNGTGEWCLEGFLTVDDVSTTNLVNFISRLTATGATDGFRIYVSTGTTPGAGNFQVWINLQGCANNGSTTNISASIPVGTYHYAANRVGDTLRLSIDGIVRTSIVLSNATIDLPATAMSLAVTATNNTNQSVANDSVRFSQTAVYTTFPFTPPSSALTDQLP